MGIIPLGDSITDGVGSSDGGGYRKPLINSFPALITEGPLPNFDGGAVNGWYWHAGYDGRTSALVRGFTDGTSDDIFNTHHDANVVLLHVGTNDYIVSGGDPSYTVNNVLGMRTNFFARRASNIRLAFIVMLTINAGSDPSNDPLNNYVTALRPALTTALTGLSNTYIAQPPIPNIPDANFLGGASGIHLLDAGNVLMVDDGHGHGWKFALNAAGF